MSKLQNIVVIGHNLRSSYNVGSILRTCDGLGISQFIATGTTPHPRTDKDIRLPHIIDKQTRQIAKTALGAENTVKTEYLDLAKAILELKDSGYTVCALEQSENSISVSEYRPSTTKIALIVGNEVSGIDKNTLELCHSVIEIPMDGQKESFNVSVATGIALWQLKQLNRS